MQRSTGWLGVLIGVLAISGCVPAAVRDARLLNPGKLAVINLPVLNSPEFQHCMKGYISADQTQACSRKVAADDLLTPASSDARAIAAPDVLETRELIVPPAWSSAGGRSPSKSDAVRARALAKVNEIYTDPTFRRFQAMFNHLRGGRAPTELLQPLSATNGDGAALDFDINAFADLVGKLHEATSLGAWDVMVEHSRAVGVTPEEERRAHFVSAYMRAYFRNGRFYAVTIKLQALTDQAKAKLKNAIPGLTDEEAAALVKDAFGWVNIPPDTKTIGTIEDHGLTTRGGQAIKFPSVTVDWALGQTGPTVTKLDFVGVGADLIRVFLAAVFDAHDGVPAVVGATGATEIKEPAKPLELNKPEVVAADQFAEIETLSTQLEGATASGVGTALRGLGIVALNNEALATAIETSIGALVRKHAEKVLWCWYACQDKAAAQPGYLALNAEGAQPSSSRLVLRVTGGPAGPIAVGH